MGDGRKRTLPHLAVIGKHEELTKRAAERAYEIFLHAVGLVRDSAESQLRHVVQALHPNLRR